MKLPSIEQVLKGANHAAVRFPLVLASAFLGTVAALILTDYQGPPGKSFLFNLLFASILGIPLFIALTLIAEKRGWSRRTSIGVHLLGVVLLVAYALSLPSDIMGAPFVHVQRLLILVAALLLGVMVAPFVSQGEVNGFWQYNKTLAVRVLLAALYSGVLFAGLAVALVALKELFNLNVPPRRFAELFFVIAGIFAPWFLLAGIPRDLRALNEVAEYPRGLKVFTQYILSPLVLLYLVILYAYLAKILFQWEWPQGYVSKLILGFAGMSILSLLMLYPVRDKEENRWVRMSGRWLWFIMLPLVVALFLALARRVGEYGITESRYIALTVAAWLAIITVYFIFSRSKSIKFIPASLCVVAFVISFGPWGAFAFSERSQVNQLQTLLTKNNLLVEGRVQKASSTILRADVTRISSLLTYLHDVHGYDRIQPWFSESLKEDPSGTGVRNKKPQEVAVLLGIEYSKWRITSPFGDELTLAADQESALDIEGYEHLLFWQTLNREQLKQDFLSDSIGYSIDSDLSVLTFYVLHDGQPADSVQVPLRSFVSSVMADSTREKGMLLPRKNLALTAESTRLRTKVFVRRVEFSKENGELRPIFYSFDLLYARRSAD